MQYFYKGYKIVTDVLKNGTDYTIFQGSRCEAVGFCMSDGIHTEQDRAKFQAEYLIDIRFETPILQEIRKLPKY